jgi:hypothetical protein
MDDCGWMREDVLGTMDLQQRALGDECSRPLIGGDGHVATRCDGFGGINRQGRLVGSAPLPAPVAKGYAVAYSDHRLAALFFRLQT